MVNVYEVPPEKLIEEAAKELQKMPEMAPPSWSICVKTGINRERPPLREDWWYIRAAAVLRSVYRLGPVGVSKLRTKYGGRKNRGYAPDKTFKSSGSILRKILQELEIVGFVKQTQVGVHKGRVVTPKGKSFMDKIAVSLRKQAPKPVRAKKEKAHKEEAPKAQEPATEEEGGEQ